MIRKIVFIALAAAALAVGIGAAAPQDADAMTIAQLKAKVACIQWTGISEYGDYQSYSFDGWYSAASFDDVNDGGYQDYRILVQKRTSACNGKFPHAPNPFLGMAAARAAGVADREHALHVG